MVQTTTYLVLVEAVITMPAPFAPLDRAVVGPLSSAQGLTLTKMSPPALAKAMNTKALQLLVQPALHHADQINTDLALVAARRPPTLAALTVSSLPARVGLSRSALEQVSILTRQVVPVPLESTRAVQRLARSALA